MIDDVSLVFCVTADVSVRERMVRRLDGLGTLVICTDLAELQAMIGGPVISGPARLPTPTTASAPAPAVVAAAPAAAVAGQINLGDLTIDPLDHRVTWRGEPLALTRLERNLLTQLATAPVGVWTYQRLFESVWGCAFLGDTSVLHSAVKRLRRKLHAVDDALRVHTVRGIGYRLSVD
ncbi:Heme response regulator HssR [Micromonospora saelicesensis]|uniref:Heme response regulator HssR n=2 Tax=Micromonospora saelicesensis TaxID=285676 RepID=A0A1C4XCV5_9ACTN|nr:Heme response regulator HssR [Micromonospora saelicesensis]RAO48670.1 Heme response regulator HssR [Micromonospora saelicesensis]SCF06051.1 Transcriptional regulatory protein, C terminal [Micromonospora saelicesensis]